MTDEVKEIRNEVKKVVKDVKKTLNIDMIEQKQKEILNKICCCEDDDALNKLLELYEKLDILKKKLKRKLKNDDEDDDNGEEKHKLPYPYNIYNNTKEDYVLLKNMFEGTEDFEDYHLVRLLTRVRIIDIMLPKRD